MKKLFTWMKSERCQRFAPWVVAGLLIIGMASHTALLTWQWLGAADADTIDATIEPLPINTQQTAIQDANSIAELHLFGESAFLAGDLNNAPQTQLNLELRGVFAFGDDAGLALIASSGNMEQLYSVGQPVPGNATLKAVFGDRVVLESARGLETLFMPKEDRLINFGDPAPAVADANQRPPHDPTALPRGMGRFEASVKNYRREFMANPAAIGDYVDITAFKENERVRGYQLNPKKDDPVLKELGVQAGDVVTAVNGIQLDNEQNRYRAIRAMMKDPNISLTVERDGQTQELKKEIPTNN
jgi:general secretion pathway protein C